VGRAEFARPVAVTDLQRNVKSESVAIYVAIR
jgi:hypothetical protein